MSRSALHSVRAWSTTATTTATQATTCTSRHCGSASSASSIALGRRPSNKIAEPSLPSRLRPRQAHSFPAIARLPSLVASRWFRAHVLSRIVWKIHTPVHGNCFSDQALQLAQLAQLAWSDDDPLAQENALGQHPRTLPGPPRSRSFSSASTSAAAAATTASTSQASPRAYISPRPHVPREVRRTTHSNKKAPASAFARDVGPGSTHTASDLPTPPRTPSETGEADDSYTLNPLTDQSLSLLFTYTTPPPLSSLSAFAGRLATSVVGADKHSAQFSLAQDLALLEQCLIHESFWTGVNTLPKSNAADRRHTHFHDNPISAPTSVTVLRAHNEPLASLGNALLGSLTAEALMEQFPNLPTRVTKAALTMFVGPKSLAAVATSWGIAPTRLDHRWVGRPDVQKLPRKDRAYGHLVGGVGPAAKRESAGGDGAAGIGLVRWNRTKVSPVKDAVLFEDALASVARAVVGAIYQTHGFNAARHFAHAHFLASLVSSTNSKLPSPIASSQILPLLKFTNPTSVLSSHLVLKASAERATHRLLKESGRLSNHATFVSGVYSGAIKLGEGFGSSIKMSEYRASEDALRRLYLGGKGVKGTRVVGSRDWDKRGSGVQG